MGFTLVTSALFVAPPAEARIVPSRTIRNGASLIPLGSDCYDVRSGISLKGDRDLILDLPQTGQGDPSDVRFAGLEAERRRYARERRPVVGSRASRSPSPSQLKASTARMIAAPGASIHGCRRMERTFDVASASMLPQDAAGSR